MDAVSEEILRQAAAAVKSGDRQTALKLTKQFVRTNPKDVRGWMALSRLSPNADIKRQCLERVLALRPDNAKAKQLLAELDAETRFDEASAPFVQLEDEETPDWMNQPVSPFREAPLYEDEEEDYFSEPDPEYEDLTSSSFIDAVADEEPDFSFALHDTAKAPAPATAKPKSSGGGWLIGVGVVMLALVAIGGLAWYAYNYRHMGLFGLLGPDLNAVAQTNDFQIRYPDDWIAQIEEGGDGFVAYTPNATDLAENVDVADLESDNLAGVDDINALSSEEMVAVTVGPITAEDMATLQQESGVEYASFQQYLEAEIEQAESEFNDIGSVSGDGGKAEIEVEGDDITVADSDGYFGAISVDFELDFGFDKLTMQMGLYMAAFRHDGAEYGFVMIAMGDGFKSHKRTARRMLRTVEFVN